MDSWNQSSWKRSMSINLPVVGLFAQVFLAIFSTRRKRARSRSRSRRRVPLSRGWSARSTGQRGVRHPKISLKMEVIYGDFLKWGYPIAGWFFMDNPMKKWRIWGYHHFRKPYINIYLYIIIYVYIYIYTYVFNIQYISSISLKLYDPRTWISWWYIWDIQRDNVYIMYMQFLRIATNFYGDILYVDI